MFRHKLLLCKLKIHLFYLLNLGISILLFKSSFKRDKYSLIKATTTEPFYGQIMNGQKYTSVFLLKCASMSTESKMKIYYLKNIHVYVMCVGMTLKPKSINWYPVIFEKQSLGFYTPVKKSSIRIAIKVKQAVIL